MELVAKHIHDKDMLPYLNQIGQHIQNLQGEGFGEYEYFVLIFQYIACAGNIPDKAAFADTVKRVLPTKAGEEIMTIVEMYKQEGLQEGLSRGKQEGRFEEKLEVARNLLSKGIDPSIVEESTKLSHEEIEELKNQVLH